MATLAGKLALRRALLTVTVLALCSSAFGQSVGVPPPPPDSQASQPVQPPPGMQRLEVGSRVVQTQPHLLGSSFPPYIRQITGKPYSLVLESEQKQTLADGTNISRKMMIRREYRDSMGRTRTDNEGVPPSGQQMNSFPMIQLADPVARYQYTLDTRAKTAKRAVARVFPSPPTPYPARMTSGRTITTIAPAGPQDHPRPTTQREDLGTQSFEGIEAEGMRMTTTFPIGAMGNDRPIETVCEHWTSRELQATVMSKCSDPRSGETTSRLTHVELSEPDPALFRVPAEYKIFNEEGQEQAQEKAQPQPWYKRLHL